MYLTDANCPVAYPGLERRGRRAAFGAPGLRDGGRCRTPGAMSAVALALTLLAVLTAPLVAQSFPITAIDVALMGKLGPSRRWGRNSTQNRQEALDALKRMEIEAFAHSKIGELSGGQRQRLFIARALVTQPKVLLLDEPTASIDAKGQAEFYRLLKELNKDITILVVSHDLVAISTYVKSVACVNKRLHYHNQAEITGEMLEEMYPCTDEEVCPVELIAHGLPHRVLKHHQD